MTVSRNNSAQDLCNKLFAEVEGPLSEAWISDDAGTDDPEEFLRHVRGALDALDDARRRIRRFLRQHT